jgi:hypothetical protein
VSSKSMCTCPCVRLMNTEIIVQDRWLRCTTNYCEDTWLRCATWKRRAATPAPYKKKSKSALKRRLSSSSSASFFHFSLYTPVYSLSVVAVFRAPCVCCNVANASFRSENSLSSHGVLERVPRVLHVLLVVFKVTFSTLGFRPF